MSPMAAAADAKTASDEVRAHLARSRALREQTVKYGNAVVEHRRRAAELRRDAARKAR